MRKPGLFALLCGLLLLQGRLLAQNVDVAFGVSGLSAPASTTDSTGLLLPSLTGGAYPGFSGNVLIKHHLGVGAEVFWRASQGLYAGFQPYRPLFFAFNGIWAPQLTKSITLEAVAGIGAESLRFYGTTENCDFISGTCTNYTSSNHFMGDVGAGLRYYVWHGAFVRPEARLYLVHNNVEFASGHAVRYGVSLGYSFGH